MLVLNARRAMAAIGLLAFSCAAAAQTTPGPAKPQPAAPEQAKPTPAATGTAAVIVDLQSMDAVIGKAIHSAKGDDLGRLIDILVGTNGDVRAAVIDFGGVLGVGSRKIAVDWRALDFSDSVKTGFIKLTMTRDQIRIAPEYRSGEPAVIVEPPKDDPGAKPAPQPASPPAPAGK